MALSIIAIASRAIPQTMGNKTSAAIALLNQCPLTQPIKTAGTATTNKQMTKSNFSIAGL